MFDKKYFNVFMAKYMPTRECFDNIKTDWAKVSGSNEIEDILEFCRKHLFDIELKADSSINFMIGNSKGSAIKIMILFQEAILNAVKYAAFVPKDKRKIVISIDSDPQSFRFDVRNSYLPEQYVKGSVLCHIIIKNFCKLLDTEPVILKTDNEFALEIKFKNIWSQHENTVH
jgi:two-component sensor histidine kinase